MPDELDAVEEAVGTDRRTFIKRLAIGTAFAAPIVSSFTMSGVGAVFGTSLGASTMMAPNASEPPAPSMYTRRICTTYPGGGNLNFGQPGASGFASVTAIANPNSGGILPTGSTVCLYEGDLVALAALFPTGQVPVSAWAVKWNVLSPGSATATVPVNLNVTDPLVLSGDAIYAVDSGSPVNVGTVGSNGAWTQSFVDDPAFVVTHTSPETPPASGGGSAPGESTAGASTGTAGAAAAVDAAPTTTG